MKLRNVVVLLLAFVFAISLVSCGGTGIGTGDPSDSTLETSQYVYTEEDVKKCDIAIDGKNISSFNIIAAGDETAKSLAEYVAFAVKGLTAKSIPVSDDSAKASANEIVIGATSRAETPDLGSDGFLVKVDGGKIYIFYAEGASMFQVVTSVLSESFFSETLIVDGKIAIENGFEAKGNATDYTTGDNEFNPFG